MSSSAYQPGNVFGQIITAVHNVGLAEQGAFAPAIRRRLVGEGATPITNDHAVNRDRLQRGFVYTGQTAEERTHERHLVLGELHQLMLTAPASAPRTGFSGETI